VVDLHEAPGRLPGRFPVGVVDIGSNSIRLVVYEGLTRSPTPLYNEKVLCGLGEQMASTGRLPEPAVERALEALRRFRALADGMGVPELFVVATAAAREAANGAAFVAEVEAICRCPVQVLTGREEAYYAALGLVAGVWKPDGLVGDLGGGSLELVEVASRGSGEAIGEGITLPLGGLRLADVSNKSLKRAASVAREALDGAALLDRGAGRAFYAIGGTWRALGRLHMFQTAYPLRVMHHYAIPAEEALEFCRLVGRGGTDALASIDAVSEARRPLLAYGALVLGEILRRASPSEIVFSAFGVREGLLYEHFDADERARDPLIVAAEEYCYLRSRSPVHARELVGWLDALFESAGLEEGEDDRRLRVAASYLSDIGWRAHPDYRGEQSLNVIAHAAFVGLTHSERAFLALAVFYRHAGPNELGRARIRELCSARQIDRARLLGLAFRLASALSGAMPGVLLHAPLLVDDGRLALALPQRFAALNGRRLQARLKQVARALGLDGEAVLTASD